MTEPAPPPPPSISVNQRLSIAGLDVTDQEADRLAGVYPSLRSSADALRVGWNHRSPASVVGPPPAEGKQSWQLVERRGDDPDSIAGIAEAIRAGRVTAVGLVEESLKRIEDIDHLLGAMVSVFATEARAAADTADQELNAGVDRGPLHGVPIVVKDILTTVEGPTRAQSLVSCPLTFELVDSVAVARMRRAGAIIVGKASTSEYTLGRPDEDSEFPDPRNPWDLTRWPGGSSSGTAVAVASGLVSAGLGTDTGGSIRMPAALCGITGFKPTLGRIPVAGCIPLAPSFDTIGPMAHSVLDCAIMFDALTTDEAAPTSESLGVADLDGVRIGVLRPHYNVPVVDSTVDSRLTVCASFLDRCGANVREVVLPEASSMHAAALIILYGEAFTIHRDKLREAWTDYGREARNRLAMGALYDLADYVTAQQVAARGRVAVAELFNDVDILIAPTLGMTAPRLDEDFSTRLGALLYTLPWNLCGLPALSVPIGFGERGLPLGAQIMGAAGADALVLKTGDAYQRVTSWHKERPAVLQTDA